MPKLTLPTVKLYGKDRQSGKKELILQVELAMLVADGPSVRVPVLVQSECPLRMNTQPLLM